MPSRFGKNTKAETIREQIIKNNRARRVFPIDAEYSFSVFEDRVTRKPRPEQIAPIIAKLSKTQIVTRIVEDLDAGLLFKVFDFDTIKPSFDNLSSSITLNSTTVSAELLYTANSASADEWAAVIGPTLTSGSTGTVPTLDAGSPLFGTNDTSVDFNAGKQYFAQPDFVSGDVTSEDYIGELVAVYDDSVSSSPFSKWLFNGGAFQGWTLEFYSPGTVRLRQNWNTGDNDLLATTGFVSGVWYHFLFAVNRDGLAYLYVNGNLSGSTSFAASSAQSLTCEKSFSIGGLSEDQFGGTQNPFPNKVSYAAFWKRDGWLSASPQTELDELAKERFAKMIGVYPQLAIGNSLPTLIDRNTTGLLDNGGTIYTVGEDWGRVENLLSPSFEGYLSEPSLSSDLLEYSGANNILTSTGSIKVDLLLPASAIVDPTDRYLFSISGSNDGISVYTNSSESGNPIVEVKSNGTIYSITGSTTIADGAEHSIGIAWGSGADKLTLHLDGSLDATGVCEPPQNLTKIKIGTDADNTNQFSGSIKNFRIYST